jgi:hypothetical protein
MFLRLYLNLYSVVVELLAISYLQFDAGAVYVNKYILKEKLRAVQHLMPVPCNFGAE